jgi:hypothetical protein
MAITIAKTAAITAGAFNSWWVKNVTLNANNLNVAFVPYNGEYALSTTPSRVNIDVAAKKTSDSTFATVINAFNTEIQRQYTVKNPSPAVTSFVVPNLNIMAQNPDRQVTLFANLVVNGANKTLMIVDIYDAASKDATFNTALTNFINELGRQGKAAGKID